MKNVGNSSRGRCQESRKFSGHPCRPYRAHCAVIFAIAQLSCSIFDLWIRAGDIRDQSRKLSEISPDLERFSPSQILGGRPSKNCTHIITLSSRHVVWIKICDDIPISPEVIDVHTLNFKPNFKFSRLKFFGGTPVPVGVCARYLRSISSAYKNFRAQHPLMAEI